MNFVCEVIFLCISLTEEKDQGSSQFGGVFFITAGET